MALCASWFSTEPLIGQGACLGASASPPLFFVRVAGFIDSPPPPPARRSLWPALGRALLGGDSRPEESAASFRPFSVAPYWRPGPGPFGRATPPCRGRPSSCRAEAGPLGGAFLRRRPQEAAASLRPLPVTLRWALLSGRLPWPRGAAAISMAALSLPSSFDRAAECGDSRPEKAVPSFRPLSVTPLWRLLAPLKAPRWLEAWPQRSARATPKPSDRRYISFLTPRWRPGPGPFGRVALLAGEALGDVQRVYVCAPMVG